MVPAGSQLSGWLPVTVLAESVTVAASIEDPSSVRRRCCRSPGCDSALLALPGRDIWPRTKPLAMPPPLPPAVLSFTRLLLRVSTPVLGARGPQGHTQPLEDPATRSNRALSPLRCCCSPRTC